MPRILSRQSAGKSFVNPLELHEGGTGKNTATDALNALYGIPSGLKGQALGPVELNGQGRLDLSALEGISLTDTGIDGDSTIQLRETKEYFLTTYDSYQDYEVEGVLGVARIERNVIYYTAGQTPGIGGFIINGRRINILVQGIAIVKPSITVPVNNAIDRPLYMTFIGTSFQTLGGSDNHVSSDWELSTDVNFIDIVQRSYDDTTNLTSWAVMDMQELKKHYVRVRYKGQNAGLSPWSNAVGFTTGNDGIANTEVQKFYAPDFATGDRFGCSVAMNHAGDYAAIGALYKHVGTQQYQGVVYIFIKQNGLWVHQQTIIEPNTTEWDYFGVTVSLNGDATHMLVGANGDDSTVDRAGAVYYYTRSGNVWTRVSKIQASDRHTVQFFGIGLALNGDGTKAVICAVYDNTRGYRAGAVYYFTRSGSTWTQGQKFYSSDISAEDFFGFNCGLNSNGDLLIVSAARDDNENGIDVGAGYIFTRSGSTWTQARKILMPKSVRPDGLFPGAVCISPDGSLLLLGNYIFDLVGTVATYSRTLNNNPIGGFGSSVAISLDKNSILVGSNDDSTMAYLAGAVHFYN